MQESKTPIYDAVTELTTDMLALASKISDTVAKFGPDELEERELALHKLLVRRAPESPAARYVIDGLKLASLDGDTKPLFGSWRHEVVKYTSYGKKETITDMIVRGLPSRVGSHLVVVAADDGTVVESGRCYDSRKRAAQRKVHVTIQHADGAVVYYNRLGEIAQGIKPGVSVHRGQVIGRVNNENGCVVLDVRRNGRKIDVAEWYGIEVNEK